MIAELVEKVKRFLAGRKGAYCRVFIKESQDVQTVLSDLARFCRAYESTFHPEHSVSDRLDGRREVWLRIEQHINLTSDELYELYGKRKGE
jgi:hypothetical protein